MRHHRVASEGFEPPKAVPADLQSDPFGHLGNSPNRLNIYSRTPPNLLPKPRGSGHLSSPSPYEQDFDNLKHRQLKGPGRLIA